MATLEQEWDTATPDLSADWEAAGPSQPPSSAAVAGQSVVKGLASIPDAVLNAPANVLNLGKAAVGYAAGELGHPEVAADMDMTQPPSPVAGTLEQIGAISPAREPQTAAQRVLDRSIQAGVNVAVAPAKGLGELIKNMAVGALSGFTGGVTKEVTGSDMAALAVSVATPLATRAMTGSNANAPTLANPVKTETIKDAQAAGYVIPPSAVKPSGVTNRLESIGGKAAIKQEASARNQAVTNKLAVQSLNSEKFNVKLPDDTVLTPTVLKDIRDKAGTAYQAIADISPKAASTLEKLKEARAEATAYFKHYDRSADPASLKKAQAFTTQANVLEHQIEKIGLDYGQPKVVKPTRAELKASEVDAGRLKSAAELQAQPPKKLQTQLEINRVQVQNKPDLVKDLKEARTLIAKTHDIERALNVGDGNVSASIIGRMLDGGRPLTGELKVIGKFAQAFPAITREGASVPAAGVSAIDPVMGTLLAGGGYAAAGGPAGLAAGALPLLRGPVRSAMLSPMYQRRLLAEQPVSLNQAALQGILAGREMAEGQ